MIFAGMDYSSSTGALGRVKGIEWSCWSPDLAATCFGMVSTRSQTFGKDKWIEMKINRASNLLTQWGFEWGCFEWCERSSRLKWECQPRTSRNEQAAGSQDPVFGCLLATQTTRFGDDDDEELEPRLIWQDSNGACTMKSVEECSIQWQP